MAIFLNCVSSYTSFDHLAIDFSASTAFLAGVTACRRSFSMNLIPLHLLANSIVPEESLVVVTNKLILPRSKKGCKSRVSLLAR